MDKDLTIEEKVLISQKYSKLYKFLLDHPELQEFQWELTDQLATLSPAQRCIVLTTKLRENQLKLQDHIAEYNELVQKAVSDIHNIIDKVKKEIDNV